MRSAPDSAAIDAAERELLSALGNASYEKRPVPLASGHVLNTLSAGDINSPSLVVVHGWGAGAAFYGKNIAGLSTVFRVHFIDWLGFGGSSRPHYSLSWTPEEAELFFINGLEEWVQSMQKMEPTLNVPFYLVGHSLGAFLAVGFTVKNPRLVKTLTLASPVGVPRRQSSSTRDSVAKPGLFFRLVKWTIFQLWDAGWTPQWLVRIFGERIGRSLCRYLILARFKSNDIRTQDALVEYFYQLSAAPPSGEHSLSTILQPGAYARKPLVDKLPRVQCPVSFVYGEKDWMDWSVAKELLPRMQKTATFNLVSNGGHHMYYDNPREFNKLVHASCNLHA